MPELLQTNTTISHYRILQKLGAGGMGEVYLAQDTKLDRKVALKILPAEVAADQTRMRRFVQEAKAASALNHPNIITIHEIEQIDSVNFIATEFIDGETLRQRMRHTPMKLGEVLDVVIQCASALSAAHATGIVHRDIKPENIMIRLDGIVKVLDFGLAKLTEQLPLESVDTEAPTSFKTNPGTVVGTAVYMSPEQARGNEIDARTDIFSLGIVLYEMVAGRLPFEGSSPNEVMVSLLSEKESQPLARYSTEVPIEFERIVSKALRKNRDERYQTIKDLLLDLQSLKQELEFQRKLERSVPPHLKSAAGTGEQAAETVMESSARPTIGERGPTSRIELNNTSVVIAVAVLLIIALGVGAYLYFMRSRSEPINSIAVLPFVNASGNADNEYLSDGMTESLISSLSQIPRLNIKARSSVFRYKGKETDLQKIAQELNVQAILSGRVAQRGEQLILNLELVAAKTENVIWSEQYTRKQADLVSLQSEIARDVSQKLKTKLSGADAQRLAKDYTQNTEAYQFYLKGQFYWNRRTVPDLQRSVEYFNQAIAMDRNYALAYAGLSNAYSNLAENAGVAPGARTKAQDAARTAISLDDNLAEAHAALAHIVKSDYDFAGAEREYKRALELNPNYATAHQWYGNLLSLLGRHEESLAELRRALDLDPFSPIINKNYGDSLRQARRNDESIEQLKKTIELNPNLPQAHLSLHEAYMATGKYAECVEEFAKYQELLGQAQAAALVRESHKRNGWPGFLRLMTSEPAPIKMWVNELAVYYAARGEKEKAFNLLEKAYHERRLLWLKVETLLDPLRDDPRFHELVRKVGFPE
jgi:eukaryotic-like serine/threonine-protein kinase